MSPVSEDERMKYDVDDDELQSLMLDIPRSVNTAAGAVRHVRDVCGVAASQERIFAIWKRIKRKNQ